MSEVLWKPEPLRVTVGNQPQVVVVMECCSNLEQELEKHPRQSCLF